MSYSGKPRPLWLVILLSGVTGLLYYRYYKWAIQEELRRYNGYGWSGALCLLPFVLGTVIPLLSRFWADLQGEDGKDPIADRLPLFFSNP